MKQNMKAWMERLLKSEQKTALPILSFPSVSLLGISVKDLLNDAKLQAKGMCLVAERTKAAASVSLMDLSVEAECFGAEIRFSEHEVPTVVGRIVEDEDSAAALSVPPVGSGRTGICIDAIRIASEEIKDRPVFAGIIGPYSLAARLIDVSESMMMCYDDPDTVHLVLEKATAFLTDYAKAFRAAGANGIVIAEPVAGLLSPSLEEEFSSPYVKQIVDAVQSEDFLVIYHNCGNNTPAMLDSILSIGASAYHFGNAIDLSEMLRRIPSDIPVMGNVDPAGEFRRGTPESIRKATLDLMERCKGYSNFVVSSGCDIPPQSPWENIDAFFSAVEEFYV